MNETQSLLGKKETPLPWSKVGLIGVVLFGNTFSLLMVFPFLPFLTHDFFPDLHESQLGYKAGYLGSVYSLGSFLAAYIWGYMADRIGRKPVLLFGLLGTCLSTIAFGCSRSFAWALTTRFIWGMLNGNVGVAKTYLSEVLDSSNQSRGFAIIGLQAGFGRLFGPAIGGLLAKPAEKYAFFDVWLFRELPYLLPSLFAAAISAVGFLGTLFFLEETHNVLDDHVESISYDDEASSPLIPTKIYTKIDKDMRKKQPSSSTSIFSLLRNRKILVSTSLYGLLAFIGILTTDTFPLWALNDSAHGGFSLSTSEIGTVFLTSAPFEIVYQLVVYPRIAQRLGVLGVHRVAIFLLGLSMFILPFSSITTSYASPTVQFAVLCLCFFFVVISRLSCFTSVFVLVNTSSTKETRGRVNGIGQTMAALARIIAPTVCSILFAWSEGNNLHFPFNFHFIFNVAFLLTGGSYILSLYYSRKPDEEEA